jgi:hypothetical protein
VSDEPSRNGPRVPSQEAQMLVKEFSDMADDFIALCRKTGNSRELSLAITNVQQACFWATMHVTGQLLR